MKSVVELEMDGPYLEVHVSGKLTKEAYETMAPAFDEGVRQHGKLYVLFLMRDFHGWTAGALWEDRKVDLKHFKDITKLAFVGESKWQKGMSVFCKPFTTAKVKYFTTDELGAAREWLREGATAASDRP